MDARDVQIRELQPVVGATVVGLLKSGDESDDEWTGLEMRTKDGQILHLWISQDIEGNGPGWLAVEEA